MQKSWEFNAEKTCVRFTGCGAALARFPCASRSAYGGPFCAMGCFPNCVCSWHVVRPRRRLAVALAADKRRAQARPVEEGSEESGLPGRGVSTCAGRRRAGVARDRARSPHRFRKTHVSTRLEQRPSFRLRTLAEVVLSSAMPHSKPGFRQGARPQELAARANEPLPPSALLRRLKPSFIVGERQNMWLGGLRGGLTFCLVGPHLVQKCDRWGLSSGVECFGDPPHRRKGHRVICRKLAL